MTNQVSMNEAKKSPSKKVGVTIRFELELAPPTDDTSNEFSYVHLVKDRDAKVVSITEQECRGGEWVSGAE